MGRIGVACKSGVPMTGFIFRVILFIAALFTIYWIHLIIVTGTSFPIMDILPSQKLAINCSSPCPKPRTPPHKPSDSSPETCPEYFRWIHEDLKPWKKMGITEKMVEKAKNPAHIRIVVVKGRVYVEKYKYVFQTRDVVTIWGILQLLKLYPGKLPDLDLMFECGDRPVMKKSDYWGSKASEIPPLLHYCGDDSTLDIVFPDWSFWGWPEVHIEPWEKLKKDLEEGNKRVKWMNREPYAHWKGNTKMGVARPDLVNCNVSDTHDWNARIYPLDWMEVRKEGFKNTDLASQCTQRYKIYVEGIAWSVSEKYILACDSVSLLIKPQFYDFFTRSLVPTVHYWPINENDKCNSIKFAVDWGNKHTQEAQELGKRGSKFIQEELKMKHVYDYMFHLLNEYAKLVKYQPSIPKNATEVCSESLICADKGAKKRYKLQSMVDSPSTTSPCNFPPPFDPQHLQTFLDRNENLTKHIQMLEKSGKIEEAIFRKSY